MPYLWESFLHRCDNLWTLTRLGPQPTTVTRSEVPCYEFFVFLQAAGFLPMQKRVAHRGNPCHASHGRAVHVQMSRQHPFWEPSMMDWPLVAFDRYA
jgi:hypothetical protein